MRVRVNSHFCFDITQEFTLCESGSLLDLSTIKRITYREITCINIVYASRLVYAAHHQGMYHMRNANGDSIRERSTFVGAAVTPNLQHDCNLFYTRVCRLRIVVLRYRRLDYAVPNMLTPFTRIRRIQAETSTRYV